MKTFFKKQKHFVLLLFFFTLSFISFQNCARDSQSSAGPMTEISPQIEIDHSSGPPMELSEILLGKYRSNEGGLLTISGGGLILFSGSASCYAYYRVKSGSQVTKRKGFSCSCLWKGDGFKTLTGVDSPNAISFRVISFDNTAQSSALNEGKPVGTPSVSSSHCLDTQEPIQYVDLVFENTGCFRLNSPIYQTFCPY